MVEWRVLRSISRNLSIEYTDSEKKNKELVLSIGKLLRFFNLMKHPPVLSCGLLKLKLDK